MPRAATLSVILLGACWTGPAADTGAATLARGRCTVHDADVTLLEVISLHFDGVRYATVYERLERLDVELAGTRGRGALASAQVELAGELVLDELAMRTRSLGLFAGWLGIRHAAPEIEAGGVVQLAVELPAGLIPTQAHVRVRCADLTFAELPAGAEAEGEDAWVVFAPGFRTPLAATPGGPAIVVVAPTGEASAGEEVDELRARVIESRGRHVRVRIEGVNHVAGWVPAASAARADAPYLNMLGLGGTGSSARVLTCAHDVPIFVRRRGQVHRVGRFKPGARISVLQDTSETEIEVDLGASELPSHVLVADTADCAGAVPAR